MRLPMPSRPLLPSAGRLACALVVLALAGPLACAQDYKPVQCTAHAAYAGRPLHPALTGLAPSAALAEQPFEAATAQRLQETFTRTRQAAAAPAMSAALAIPGAGFWQQSVAPGDASLLFWASAGKTFTAVVVLQLAQEGKISLDDTVSRWLAGAPNGDVLTVRDLLAHTGGLFSANEDLRARAAPRYRAPDETLAIARRHGAMFCPGENWRYSNTGYDLLGEIVRQVDGRAIEVAITARIITPLGLKNTRALSPGAGAPGVAPLLSGRETPIDPSWAGAAGPIVANAADMLRFWAALMEGRLLKPETVAAMSATLYPMFDTGTFYGLGVMVFDIADGERRNLWIGHAGGTPGAGAIVFYSPQDRAYVAVALTGDGPAAAVANALLKAVRAP